MGGVIDGKEPAFRREEVFGHLVSGHIADVAPVDFTETNLILAAGGGAADRGVRLKEIVNGSADEFEICVGNHLSRKLTNLMDEFFELTNNAGTTEIFEAKAIFLSVFFDR